MNHKKYNNSEKNNMKKDDKNNQNEKNEEIKSDSKTSKESTKPSKESTHKEKKELTKTAKTESLTESKKETQTITAAEDSEMILASNVAVLEKTQKKVTTPYSDFTLPEDSVKLLQSKGYTIVEEIGHGSYGKVYKSMSNKQISEVAIKVIDIKRFSQFFLKKFLNKEIELMKTLPTHPNVSQFYDVFKGSDTGKSHLFYIVMEYSSSGDLFDYILKRRFIPEPQACLWFKQLISAVEHIHKNGFAHRDLKCENLLLNSNYDIKLTDFGFCCKLKFKKNSKTQKPEEEKSDSKLTAQECRSKTFCGSLIYASPELLRGEPYLPTKTDIWSCGVILYVMLFGSYPNDGHEMEEFIRKEDHSITIPNSPEVSNECKELLNNLLVNEKSRLTIEKIKKSNWFRKKWEKTNAVINREYFENLNIPRQETVPFEAQSLNPNPQNIIKGPESDDEKPTLDIMAKNNNNQKIQS